METFSALLVICSAGEFPEQRPVTRSFDAFFDLRLNKRVNNGQAGDLRRHSAHYDVSVVLKCYWETVFHFFKLLFAMYLCGNMCPTFLVRNYEAMFDSRPVLVCSTIAIICDVFITCTHNNVSVMYV